MTIESLEDLHIAFSDELIEDAPPQADDPRYKSRTRWFNRGRDDIAKRWFLKPLLKNDTVAITDGVGTLPADLQRHNALLVFATDNGILYTDPYDTSDGVLSITRDLTTGRYKVLLTPVTVATSATIWYFATPPLMVDPADLVLIDGEAVLFYALTRHYFASRQYAPMQEARDEYENRVDQMLKNNEIPAPGSLLDMRSFTSARHVAGNERQFYPGRQRRSA